MAGAREPRQRSAAVESGEKTSGGRGRGRKRWKSPYGKSSKTMGVGKKERQAGGRGVHSIGERRG